MKQQEGSGCKCELRSDVLTENARLENEGQKWNNGMKCVDRKMQDK